MPLPPESTRNILAADIGGTHSRFGHFTLGIDGRLVMASSVWLRTANVDSFVDLLASLADTEFTLPPGQADAAVFAVPGAVTGRRLTFANIAWTLDLDAAKAAFGLRQAVYINDFLAQAHGCRTEAAAKTESVIPGAMDTTRVQAVVGAGTGLGKAALVPTHGGGYLALPSEGGHATAHFIGDEERAFEDYLCRATGKKYVWGDVVLSGSGLARLHHFLTGQDLPPAEVGAGLTPDSRTAQLYSRFYGRAVRDYVLTVLATGGVFITGGVAAKNPILVKHPEFGRELVDSPKHGRLLAKVPVRLLRNQETGLYGAARYAQIHFFSKRS